MLEGLKLMMETDGKAEIERLTTDLNRQHQINKNMKKEVLELNELITDHIQMSRKKIEERDREIAMWKQKYESATNISSNIKVEDDEVLFVKTDSNNPPRLSLETIKEEE